MTGEIFAHSRFAPEEFSNGGCKRTAQIHEILRLNNIAFQAADLDQYSESSKSLSAYLRGIRYNKKVSANFRNDHNIGRYIKAFDEFVEEKKPSLLIWESVSDHFLLLAKTLQAKIIPFIALPHNIESLTKGSRSFASGLASPHWFKEEIKYLTYSNKVFTISLEEQWLLSLYGINADYLPYYPTISVKSYLLDIRKEKEKQPRKIARNLLLLGTFYNPPTLNGYKALLAHLSLNKDLTVNVAGFGSEKLANLNSPNIKIWGTVSNETLKRLIIDNDVIIVQQEPTTGALTRIPELLIAGIPVIANTTAARSYHNLSGVSVYNNYQELFKLIGDTPITPPPVPAPPTLAEKRFIEAIKSCIQV
jgi:hypothetical protein